jgi:hypothetical protein
MKQIIAEKTAFASHFQDGFRCFLPFPNSPLKSRPKLPKIMHMEHQKLFHTSRWEGLSGAYLLAPIHRPIDFICEYAGCNFFVEFP